MRPSILSIAELRSRSGVKWHRYADDVVPAWVAEMDFGVAEPIQEVMRRLVDEASYGYEGETLYTRLAEAFVAYMDQRYHWPVRAELVLPVADLVQALFASVQVFTAPGQGVGLLTPIYPPFLYAVREMGRRVVEHRLLDDGTRFVVDTDTLAGAFDRDTPLLLLCNPHNPTGRVFERHELEALAALVVERNMIVVTDEVHADLVYPGHVHVPFASLGPQVAERTITITSATKGYNIPGLRCGLMYFGSEALRERFRAAVPDHLLGRVNRFGIEATIAAWQACPPWLEAVMPLLDANRQTLSRFLAAELPAIRFHPPEATYLSWLDCRELQLPGSPFQFFLDEARVALSDGAEFGPPGQGCVRLNFGTSAPILDEVLQRLAAAVRTTAAPSGVPSRR
jgi:cystathionine beta-lyase